MASRDKHGGAGGAGAGGSSPAGRGGVPPPRPQPPRRKEQLRADFLLNFQRPPAEQRSQAYAPPPRRSNPRQTTGKRSAPAALGKGRFVQSAFRLLVDSVTPDVAAAILDADALLDWGTIRLVEFLCEEPPQCPICLEVDMVVPKITRCGHIFCAPCVMRYFHALRASNGLTWQKCPLCTSQVAPDELMSVRFRPTRPLREGDTVNFVLAKRGVSSTVVRMASTPACSTPQRRPSQANRPPALSGSPKSPSALPAPPSERLPVEGAPGWQLTRLVRLPPGEGANLVAQELEALSAYRAAAEAERYQEVLPSIQAAAELVERLHRERVSSDAANDDYLDDQPFELLPEAVGDEAGAQQQLEEVDEPENDEEPPRSWAISPSSGPSGTPSASPAGPLLLESPCGPSPAPSPKTTPTADSGPRTREGPCLSFFQVEDGRHIFFQPFFTRLLLHEHGGRWDALPAALPGLKLERVQSSTVTEEMRKRHKFLAHLPLGSLISFVEVDLRDHLSRETKEYFAEEFLKRRQQRKKEQIRSRKEERIGKSRAEADEERYYKELNLTRSTQIQALPTQEDFAALLPGRAPPPTDGATGPDGEAADGGAEEEEETGPTLADKIKEKMSKNGKKKEAPSARVSLEGSQFPSLGGGGAAEAPAASSSQAPAASAPAAGKSAWGTKLGASSVRQEDSAAAAEAAGAAKPPEPADEQPTFGEALEAALRSSKTAEEEVGEAAPGKKKKGRAAKGTTIRLFG